MRNLGEEYIERAEQTDDEFENPLKEQSIDDDLF